MDSRCLLKNGSLVVSVSATTAERLANRRTCRRLAASVVEQWKTISGSYIRVQRIKGRYCGQTPPP